MAAGWEKCWISQSRVVIHFLPFVAIWDQQVSGCREQAVDAVGCLPDPANIFFDKKFFDGNPDFNNPEYQTKHGIYKPHCGFDNVLCSFGHDEYLSIVLKAHNADLAAMAARGEETPEKRIPPEGIYMIRFHSFYPWHSPKGQGQPAV